MYAYLKGTVDKAESDQVVIECGGVGYDLIATNSTVSSVKVGETAKIYVYLSVSEDSQRLYGFSSLEEKNMFLRLINVNGVGPKMGITILSSISPQQLAVALVTGDIKILTRVSGVGKKTAERLILELKEKVTNQQLLSSEYDNIATVTQNSYTNEAMLALMGLGMTQADAMKAVNLVKDKAKTAEELILLALKAMDHK